MTTPTSSPLFQTDRDWVAAGKRLSLNLPRGTTDIFVREGGGGHGKSLVFLHGFPTSSWDWSRVEPWLAKDHSLLFLDFLGFGHSDKPRRHRFSYAEQTDIAVQVIAAHRRGDIHLVVHDYAVTVGQELLARQAAGRLPFRIASLTFLNGAVYGAQHKTLPLQKALRMPIIGWLLSQVVSKGTVRSSLSKVFSVGHPLSDAEFDGHWRSISHNDGHRLAYKLIHYLGDRRKFGSAWELAMEKTSVPLQFIWGMTDPVSGAHVLEYAKTRMPGLHAVPLDDVGHYPQIEAPKRVADAIGAFVERSA